MSYALWLLAACSPSDSHTVWGPASAEDASSARDVVEVFLTADESAVQFVDEGWATVWAYNGQVPGPTIEATVGDTIRVHLTNNLAEPTTIHWHGLRIDDAMDGVPAMQDPVQPGETFTYEFVAPDPGSYWYHPHVRAHEQIEKGLQGALVIHEVAPPLVSRDRYLVLDDILLDTSGDIVQSGLGGMTGMHGRFGNTLLTNGSANAPTDTIEGVERWRIVNTANARTMSLDIEGADWRVMAIDGSILAEPFTPPRLQVPVGRRFDVEVTPTGAAPVRLVSTVPGQMGNVDVTVFEATPSGVELTDVDWGASPVPERHDIEQDLEIVLATNTTGPLRWTINGAVYGEGDAIPVVADTPTRITIRETSGFEHPFHLHGQFFQALSVDGSDAVLPGQMDTMLIGGGTTVELYSMFDNPGTWMAHCHILEHAELGMMTEMHVE